MANTTERENPWMSSPPAATNYTNRTLQSFFNPGAGQTFTPQLSVRTMDGGTIAQDVPGWNPFDAPATVANFLRPQQPGIVDPSIVARQTTNVPTIPASVPAPAPEPQPAAAKAAPQPISIVRGLQNTEYLPSINERGQVQYKAKMTAADELAAAKSTAEIAKLFGEAKKAETPSASDTAINTYLGLIKGQYEPMLKSPDANVRTQAVTEYKNAVADVIAKFGSDALLARLFGTTEK